MGDITFGGTQGFVIFVGIVFPLAAALLYLAVRHFLPSPAALGGAIFGVILLGTIGVDDPMSPDNVDFAILEPLWLAVAGIVALALLFGVTFAVLATRFDASVRPLGTGWRHAWTHLPLLLLLLPPFVVVTAIYVLLRVLLRGRTTATIDGPARKPGASSSASARRLRASPASPRPSASSDPTMPITTLNRGPLFLAALIQAVADAACGLDAVRHRTEFLAEAAHDDIHDVASADIGRAPDPFDEFGAGHGAARSFGQRCEHAEFEGRELNSLLSEIDGAVLGVEEPPVGDSELGGGEAGQPAVDGLGPEVERGGVVGVVAERDGFQELESQHGERVQRTGRDRRSRCRSDPGGDASGSSAACSRATRRPGGRSAPHLCRGRGRAHDERSAARSAADGVRRVGRTRP